jgi:hypothetical protein
MKQLRARVDWLKVFVEHHPGWEEIIQELIESDVFFVIPAKKYHPEYDGDLLLVVDPVLKSKPPLFKLQNGMVLSVNYPDSLGVMSAAWFLQYVHDIQSEGLPEPLVSKLAATLSCN